MCLKKTFFLVRIFGRWKRSRFLWAYTDFVPSFFMRGASAAVRSCVFFLSFAPNYLLTHLQLSVLPSLAPGAWQLALRYLSLGSSFLSPGVNITHPLT